MPKSLFCLVVFLLSGGTAAAQYPDDEYYPYAEREERRELLVTDSTLFYRAVQSAADLYGEQTDFNLPQVAFKRRGLERRAGRISFAGMDLSYRYLPGLAAAGRGGDSLRRTRAAARRVGRCGRRPSRRVFRRGAVAALSGVGAADRPQLPRGGEGRRLGASGAGVARLAGAGCPHGTRHARRGRLHQCPDRRTAALPPFRRGARLVAGLHRPALGAGHASFLLGGGFHADGRPALQSGVGLSGRAGAQFARAARDAAAPRRRLRRAALGGGLALAPPRGRSGRRALQHARLVRRPHPDARQLPLPAELHGRSRNRAGVAHARPALYADRLGRADSPQPDAGRSCGLCARRPGGAARASLPQRRLFGPHGLPPDAPLRGVAAQRPNPFLPADARPARGGGT